MSHRSNTASANEADAEHRYKIGRARCPRCRKVRAYVAHVDVADLRCPGCDAVCEPAHEEEADGEGES